MKVIKRDGTSVDYDRSKIVIAIEKANAEVAAEERLDRAGIEIPYNQLDVHLDRTQAEQLRDIL